MPRNWFTRHHKSIPELKRKQYQLVCILEKQLFIYFYLPELIAEFQHSTQ